MDIEIPSNKNLLLFYW